MLTSILTRPRSPLLDLLPVHWRTYALELAIVDEATVVLGEALVGVAAAHELEADFLDFQRIL